MKTFKSSALVFAISSLCAPAAFGDECDHVGRHHKTDLEVTGVSTYPQSMVGDIQVGPTLTVRVRNAGVTTFERNMPDDSIINARTLAIAVKGRILYGYMNAPLAPGEETTVSFSVDQSWLTVCERASVAIDVDNSLGQWGCMVRSNDTRTFRAVYGQPERCVRLP